MSKQNYDSEFCGSLPLHFINQIQAYGVLLVLERDTFKVVQVSQNTEEKLGVAVSDIIDSLWQSYLPEDQFALFKSKCSSHTVDRLPFTFSFITADWQTECLAIIHIKPDYLILEIEIMTPEESSNRSFLTVYQDIRYVMALLDSAPDITQICNIALAELKRTSGFDRIMIYQFDENWNGTVIAEIREEGMEPYLGLVFPASDVPRQARALYLKNPYRQIPDRNYTPVKLYPVLNPVTETFIDLSDCNLRGVAGVHIEYLQNMQVSASMSIRILKDDQLWGLISCHHRQARFLPYEVCSVFELLSGIISARLSRLQAQEEFQFNSHLQTIQSRLVEQLYTEDDLAESLLKKEVSVMALLHAEGAAVVYEKNIVTAGITPAAEEIRNLVMWLQGDHTDKVFHTSHIASVYDNETLSNGVAGMVAIPFHPGQGAFILLFRPEVIQKINWGGNPNEAVRFEKDSKIYHPRNSFRLWQQTVKNTSLPWHPQEILIAESFRNILLEYSLKKRFLNSF